MSPRHRVILLLTSACGAAALLCPLGYPTTPAVTLGPLVSAAPPVFDSPATAPEDSPLIAALRREAGLALSQLQGRPNP